MNILFVYPSKKNQSSAKPLQSLDEMQFGISYISSLLKHHGHSTKMVVLSKILGEGNKKILDKSLKEFHPEIICFTSVATEYNFIKDIAHYVKNIYPEIYLLLGGPHASLNPQEVISGGGFNAICIGEGEYPTLELASQLENGLSPTGIPNLWIIHGDEIEKNQPRPFIKDLDVLPFPDREMWMEWLEDAVSSRCSILLGRGCPFRCTYCCNHALRKIAEGEYVRYRTPDNIIGELKTIIKKFPLIKEIYLEIESIGANIKWALQLCAELKKLNMSTDRPLAFGANLRLTPNMDIEDLMAAFKRSNFRFINIGLESGSERIRREVLNRHYSNQDVINAVNLARKYGLKVFFYNMLGLPDETIDDFKETIKMNRICLPDVHYTSIFFPYPGTKIYSLCKEKGLIRGDLDGSVERNKAVLDIPTFPRREIQKYYTWFDYYVYKGRKPLYKIFLRIIVAKLQSNPYLNHLYRKITRLPLIKQLKRGFREY